MLGVQGALTASMQIFDAHFVAPLPARDTAPTCVCRALSDKRMLSSASMTCIRRLSHRCQRNSSIGMTLYPAHRRPSSTCYTSCPPHRSALSGNSARGAGSSPASGLKLPLYIHTPAECSRTDILTMRLTRDLCLLGRGTGSAFSDRFLRSTHLPVTAGRSSIAMGNGLAVIVNMHRLLVFYTSPLNPQRRSSYKDVPHPSQLVSECRCPCPA
jgi:hypothetical protein